MGQDLIQKAAGNEEGRSDGRAADLNLRDISHGPK